MDRYKKIKEILHIKENDSDENLDDYVTRSLDSIMQINNATVNDDSEELIYLNRGNYNSLRSSDDNYSNIKDLKVNSDNYYVIKK